VKAGFLKFVPAFPLRMNGYDQIAAYAAATRPHASAPTSAPSDSHCNRFGVCVSSQHSRRSHGVIVLHRPVESALYKGLSTVPVVLDYVAQARMERKARRLHSILMQLHRLGVGTTGLCVPLAQLHKPLLERFAQR
jgi:hypothetical protein